MTKETEVSAAAEPVVASRDREDDPKLVEVVENVEIVEPEDQPISAADSDDPRGDIYKRHSKKRETEIAGEIEPIGGENEELGGENDESGLESAETSDIIQSDGDQPSTPSDDDPLIEVTIFESVRMVPQSKVEAAGGLQMYQLREAAYEQMRRNAARANELDNREQALNDRDHRAAQPPAVPSDQLPGQPPTDLPSDDQNLETMARQYQDAVLDGDENAPSILTSMVKTAAQTGQTFDQNAFRVQVKEEVLADQRRTKVVQARQALFDKTPELDQRRPDKFDHRLFQAVDDETDVIVRQHPEWEPEQVINNAWENVRKWHGPHKTETMDVKNKDKQELNRPRAATGRFKPPAPPPRETNSEYVHRQRVARGLEPE